METGRRVLVLTDLVDSTRITAELGDERAAALWAAHDNSIRTLIAAHRGIEIDKSDGFLVVFESVPDAIAFQSAYHAALAPPLRARIGVHAGDVILRRQSTAQIARGAKPIEIDGLAKPLTARLMALAGGGQTLVTADVAALSSVAHPLGHYRLKGIEDPVEVWALSGERPADGEKAHRVVVAGGRWIGVDALAHGLGTDADPLIGRTDELARLDSLQARVMTIVGPGGVGKTRLARHWVETHLVDFRGGTYFVDLAAASDEAGLLRAIANALEVQLGPNPAAQLGHAIHARGRMLLVLDNFEQLVAQASHVAAWTTTALELTVLVTSRQRLGLREERLVDLDPLPLPPPADAPSVALFVRRAQQIRPDFSLDPDTLPVVVDIVRRLDGLPLALELAAARLRALGVVQLRDRLSLGVLKEEARPDRQRTLTATIAWSWQLLAPEGQVVLRECSVFRGAFDLDWAEAVLTAGEDVLDLLQELVDKSLVRAQDAGAGRTRYRLLESIRAFGEEKLAVSGHEKAVRDRHARWIFALASHPSTDPVRLSDALPNLRVALHHASTDPVLAREGMPLVYRVPFWTTPEGLELTALAGPLLEGSPLGQLLLYESQLRHENNDLSRVLELDERAHEIFVRAGDMLGAADALSRLAYDLFQMGDPRCEAVADAAVEAADATGHEGVRVRARSNRAAIWAHLGRPHDAETAVLDDLRFSERTEPSKIGLGWLKLGVFFGINGRASDAANAFQRAATFLERDGRKGLLAETLANLGEALTEIDPARAIEALERGLTLSRSQGLMRTVHLAEEKLIFAYLLAGRMEEFAHTAAPGEPASPRDTAFLGVARALRAAWLDDAPRARERLDQAVRDLEALGETEGHWGKQRALASAFVALAEARAGSRTQDDGVAIAHTEAAGLSEPARRAIEREIERTRQRVTRR